MSFDEKNRFVFSDFSDRSAFSSFLPGIAGLHGIPLWVFYVNRGQGITSFGFADKNNSILEFVPANKAYQQTALSGFRTFIKIIGKDNNLLFEPFSDTADKASVSRTMFIGANEFEIRETNRATEIETSVLYFTLPNETFGSLCRRVTIKNISSERKQIELVDGLPVIVPYGINNWVLKEMSNTGCAWMGVENTSNNIPFFRALSSLEDKPDVEEFKAGHFSLCFREEKGTVIKLRSIVDPACLFGQTTSWIQPAVFASSSIDEMLNKKQIMRGKMPCSFFCDKADMQPEQELTYFSLIGRSDDVAFLNAKADSLFSASYFEQKHNEATQLINGITDVINTDTASKELNLYCRQSYLDNLMRGGIPVFFPSIAGQHVYYVYSRKHGDIERDYNFFSIAPEYYSQGNGNFRDVNQNRRNDIFFEPELGTYLIKLFFNAIQIDGYNPLVIKGSVFRLQHGYMDQMLSLVHVGDRKRVQSELSGTFTPGKLLSFIQNHSIRLNTDTESFVLSILRHSTQEQQAEFGEGYWVDHWTYNLDLLDAYLRIFPDKKDELFFQDTSYTFYDSAHRVNPRDKKYRLVQNRLMQLHAVEADKEKEQLINRRSESPNVLRNKNGEGEIVYVNLFTKLLSLAIIKFSTLDSLGIGIEMEAEKPGWYDALNGLPGQFGSSVSETYELQRLLSLLIEIVEKNPGRQFHLPGEVHNLLIALNESLSTATEYTRWEHRSTARETFREAIRFGVNAGNELLRQSDLLGLLKKFSDAVSGGLTSAFAMNNGLPPTYFRYEPQEWGEKQSPDSGTSLQIFKFQPVMLPLFLEGVVKAMRNAKSPKEATAMYAKIKASGLYDAKLKMYKVNESLAGQPATIGRTTAFPPGWLENESVFLHMEYKYILALLQAGLYNEFFDELKNILIPFQNPDVYGRSILENSSFIASSAHPDASIHGRGYVARLSGSTAEFLTMWSIITAGPQPFQSTNGALELKFEPVLPDWFFKEDGTLSFTFLSKIQVTYHNPERKSLFPGCGINVKKILYSHDGTTQVKLPGGIIHGEPAKQVRDRRVKSIDVYF